MLLAIFFFINCCFGNDQCGSARLSSPSLRMEWSRKYSLSDLRVTYKTCLYSFQDLGIWRVFFYVMKQVQSSCCLSQSPVNTFSVCRQNAFVTACKWNVRCARRWQNDPPASLGSTDGIMAPSSPSDRLQTLSHHLDRTSLSTPMLLKPGQCFQLSSL